MHFPVAFLERLQLLKALTRQVKVKPAARSRSPPMELRQVAVSFGLPHLREILTMQPSGEISLPTTPPTWLIFYGARPRTQRATPSGQVAVYGLLSGGGVGTNLIPNGTYTLTNRYSGMVIDDPGFSTKQSTVMVQWPVNGGSNQKWILTNLGNNVVSLVNASSGQSLEIMGGSRGNSALVDQYPYQGNAWQQWQVTSVAAGYYELTNLNSGLALDNDGQSKTAGAKIDQYPYKATSWQQWSFR